MGYTPCVVKSKGSAREALLVQIRGSDGLDKRVVLVGRSIERVVS